MIHSISLLEKITQNHQYATRTSSQQLLWTHGSSPDEGRLNSEYIRIIHLLFLFPPIIVKTWIPVASMISVHHGFTVLVTSSLCAYSPWRPSVHIVIWCDWGYVQPVGWTPQDVQFMMPCSFIHIGIELSYGWNPMTTTFWRIWPTILFFWSNYPLVI